jgi:hypothetical protein
VDWGCRSSGRRRGNTTLTRASSLARATARRAGEKAAATRGRKSGRRREQGRGRRRRWGTREGAGDAGEEVSHEGSQERERSDRG